MKRTSWINVLGLTYAGALWIEYQTAVLLGAGCFLLVAGSALTFLAVALYRAPEGYERREGFHVYGREIAGRAWFVTADSRNPHVHDDEMRLAIPEAIPLRDHK